MCVYCRRSNLLVKFPATSIISTFVSHMYIFTISLSLPTQSFSPCTSLSLEPASSPLPPLSLSLPFSLLSLPLPSFLPPLSPSPSLPFLPFLPSSLLSSYHNNNHGFVSSGQLCIQTSPPLSTNSCFKSPHTQTQT